LIATANVTGTGLTGAAKLDESKLQKPGDLFVASDPPYKLH
jgi:hypothetical protein